MLDAFGRPQTVVVLGGTSEIAQSLLAKMRRADGIQVVLAGRDAVGLQRVADQLTRGGARVADLVQFDATSGAAEETVDACFRAIEGPVDMAVVAVGLLGDDGPSGLDPGTTTTMLTVNATWPAAACSAVAARMVAQGYGRIVVLSSVAGVRVRRSNFLYGAAKSGLDAFAIGLSEALRGTGVLVHVVRPGFVRTKMTAGRPPAPFATGADDVAQAILTGIVERRQVIWVPGTLRVVFGLIGRLPQTLWRRLPG